jgi:hypothetical protein
MTSEGDPRKARVVGWSLLGGLVVLWALLKVWVVSAPFCPSCGLLTDREFIALGLQLFSIVLVPAAARRLATGYSEKRPPRPQRDFVGGVTIVLYLFSGVMLFLAGFAGLQVLAAIGDWWSRGGIPVPVGSSMDASSGEALLFLVPLGICLTIGVKTLRPARALRLRLWAQPL